MVELQLLDQCNFIVGYEVQDFKQGDNFYYLKVRAELQNKTILMIRLYIDDGEYKYAYHWQNENNVLIVRWDNSPHHNNIITYPHHKHLMNSIEPSYEITLEDVLKYIQKKL